jgi:hypothetical protein
MRCPKERRRDLSKQCLGIAFLISPIVNVGLSVG